jgi:hypothetical protein
MLYISEYILAQLVYALGRGVEVLHSLVSGFYMRTRVWDDCWALLIVIQNILHPPSEIRTIHYMRLWWLVFPQNTVRWRLRTLALATARKA